jgi:hypothetical protein
LYIKRLTKMLENTNGNVQDTDPELNVDTTGLNIENIGLNIDNRLNIDAIGINKYTELCVKSVQLDTCYETNTQTLCGIHVFTEMLSGNSLLYSCKFMSCN